MNGGISKLNIIPTGEKSWFTIETEESLRAHKTIMNVIDVDSISSTKQKERQTWLFQHAFDQAGNKIDCFPVGKAKQVTAPSGGSWAEFSVERWRNAVYVNAAYFGQLIEDSVDFVTQFAKHQRITGRRVSLVDVGCGTGEFVWPLIDQFRLCVGVDFNPHFLEFCRAHVPSGKENKCQFILGDASKLEQVLEENNVEFKSDVKIVTCVGNTIGIIPKEIRKAVYEQMAEVAGDDGIVVVIYWSASSFGDACQNFYYKNPQLCGKFTGDCIDFDNCNLKTPSGYSTHWSALEEVRGIIGNLGMEEVVLEEKGKGVLAAFRRARKD
jgi:ubiquinone/menaquinone biosynthesis C-methylase UbiE